MKKVVYKFPVVCDNVVLPLNAEILSVKIVKSDICIYALIDPTETANKKHEVLIVGTGCTIDEEMQEKIERMTFLDTLIEPDEFFGEMVWHIWVEK